MTNLAIKLLMHFVPEAEPWFLIAFEFGWCGVKRCWC
jgi:hypothetical protein